MRVDCVGVVWVVRVRRVFVLVGPPLSSSRAIGLSVKQVLQQQRWSGLRLAWIKTCVVAAT